MAVELVRAAFAARGLTPCEKLVLAVYAERASAPDFTAFGGTVEMASLLDVSPKSVERARHVLERKGYLEMVERGGGRGMSHVYRLAVKPRLNVGESNPGIAKNRHPKPRHPDGVSREKPRQEYPVFLSPQPTDRVVEGGTSFNNVPPPQQQKKDFDSAAVDAWLADRPDVAKRLLDGQTALLETGPVPLPEDPVRRASIIALAVRRRAAELMEAAA